MIDLGLQGKHVLVSGANGGIGLPTVKLLLEQGAIVTAQYRSSCQNLEDDEYLQTCQQNKTFLTIKADVSNEQEVKDLFDQSKSLGLVTGLVVNHAIYIAEPSPIWEMELSQFKRTHESNLVGSFLLIREFLRRQVEEGKSTPTYIQNASPPTIVLIGSTAGEFGEANHSDYASSKSALTHGLMRSIKNEIVKVHPKGRINTVAPGWVATAMAEESLKDDNIRYQAMATTPMKKIATPEDIANQIVILLSDKLTGHTTGEIIKITGGMEGRLLNPR